MADPFTSSFTRAGSAANMMSSMTGHPRSRRRAWRLFRALAAGLLLAVSATSTTADPRLPARVVILVGFGPGQGNDQPARPDATALAANRMTPDMSYDQTARFLARHLGRHLPGSPPVEARQAPGAAGLVAAQRLYDATPNGGVLALLSSNVVFASALNLPGARFRADRFTWIGGVARDAWACVRRNAAAGRDALWTGTLGVGSRSDVQARALRDLASLPLKVAPGYVSRFELARALETGEIDAACGWPVHDLRTRRAGWFASGQMDILASFAPGPASAASLAPPGRGRTVLDVLANEGDFAWPLAAPPGMTAGLAEMFQAAFAALSADEAAAAEARSMGVALEPVSAATLARRVRMLHDLPADAKSALARLYARP